ncbi:hypothetical protein Mal64_30350 [Pseudobythopirellula maris]|uniref:Uncharacterized protein n=1 Tax=Pseudobythopirellula maris TaxID=2527991 RepID=A0A5C5ZJT1_9BACT|nr:hypothetical protein Mal64_30350 [Pseudobythopirellula maris]
MASSACIDNAPHCLLRLPRHAANRFPARTHQFENRSSHGQSAAAHSVPPCGWIKVETIARERRSTSKQRTHSRKKASNQSFGWFRSKRTTAQQRNDGDIFRSLASGLEAEEARLRRRLIALNAMGGTRAADRGRPIATRKPRSRKEPHRVATRPHQEKGDTPQVTPVGLLGTTGKESGGGGNRTRVPRPLHASFYVCSQAIWFRTTGALPDTATVGLSRYFS